jgi:hypothetical protein
MLTLAVTIIAAIIALSQAYLLYIQTRESRVALCAEVVDVWEKSCDSWRVMIAAAMRGGENEFYAPALTAAEKGMIDKLIDMVETFNSKAREPLPPGGDLTEKMLAKIEKLGKILPRGYSQEQLWLSEHCRTALGALSLVSELVLTGRVSTGDAYVVLGTDIARHSKALRDVLCRNNRILAHVDTMGTQRGIRNRIMVFIDLMWVEAARRDDLPPLTLDKVAALKRSGSGRIAKERLRAQCKAVKSSPFTCWRLERMLSYAERNDFGKRQAWS